MSRPVPHCQDAMRWLKDRKWDLAPLTGQDAAALRAIAHCWELYFRSDFDGQKAALFAVASLLRGCQENCWPMARELIAQAGDWSHRNSVWGEVVRIFDAREAAYAVSSARPNRLATCHVGLKQVHP